MSRIEMGTIKEGYEAFLVTKGFDYQYEIVEEEEVTNTYDTLEEFAEAVMMIINPMGFYTMRRVARELLEKVDDKEAVIKELGISEEAIEWLS